MLKITLHDELPFLQDGDIELMDKFFDRYLKSKYITQEQFEKLNIHVYCSDKKRHTAAIVFQSWKSLLSPTVRIYRTEMAGVYKRFSYFTRRRTFYIVLFHEFAHIVRTFNYLPAHKKRLNSRRTTGNKYEEKWCTGLASQFVGDNDIGDLVLAAGVNDVTRA